MSNRIFLITSVALLLSFTACGGQSPVVDSTPAENIKADQQSDSYMEYAFDSGDDVDLGFTKRELERLQTEQTLQSSDSLAIEDQLMHYVRTTETEMANGVLEKYEWNGDVYELMGGNDAGSSIPYPVLKNGEPLFEESMVFSADGAIRDWRMVDGKPAFTFNTSCPVEDNTVICTADIWYDGALISKEFSVEDPRYLFSYNGKLGFVANNGGMDSVYYDGAFVTPGFTTIWTENCCSYTEVLPTVYEDGTLLFYAKRDEQNYLVETHLE